MKGILKELKLIDHLTTELEIQKSDFVKRFRNNVDEGSTDFISDSFDVFSSSKNEYKGHVGYESFKIKRRRRFFDMNINFALAEGTYQQNDRVLIIHTEIHGFSGIMIPFYIFIIIFYSIFIVSFALAENVDSEFSSIPFILFHGAFMMGIPYLIMRRSMKRMKHELEREFYYMTRQ